MLKVNISLPNGTSISMEATDPDMQVQTMDLLHRYLSLKPSHNGNVGSHSVESMQVLQETRSSNSQKLNGAQIHPPKAPSIQPQSQTPSVSINKDFLDFCQTHNPSGDMRRIVVAAEAARECLGLGKVSVQELGPVMDSLGWPKPVNMVQTVRNASRRSFGWLERVPGRRGYYTVTDKARQEVLSSW